MNAINGILNSLPGANEAWVTGLGFVLLGIATKVNDNILSAAWHFDDLWVQTAVGLITLGVVHGIAKARTQTIQQKQGV
jgi:hypothetical protein